jgi:hypothetical protein
VHICMSIFRLNRDTCGHSHICTPEGVGICVYLKVFLSDCTSCQIDSIHANITSILCFLLCRIGRSQAHEISQEVYWTCRQAQRASSRLRWTSLIPPCPGGERTAQVARQPMCGKEAGCKANSLSTKSCLKTVPRRKLRAKIYYKFQKKFVHNSPQSPMQSLHRK